MFVLQELIIKSVRRSVCEWRAPVLYACVVFGFAALPFTASAQLAAPGALGGFGSMGTLGGVASAGGAFAPMALDVSAAAAASAGAAAAGGGQGDFGAAGAADGAKAGEAAALEAGERSSGKQSQDETGARTPSTDGDQRALPDLVPNDFQRFVLTNTGRALPLFGSNLFRRAPSSFAPNEAAPVPADYVIGPGDQLLVRATGVLDFELRPTVDRDGQIVIPKVGPVSVAGVKRVDLESYLTRQIGRSYKNFTVSATLGRLRSIDIYVTGQARRPGKYTVSSLSSLLNAVFTSGGPNAHGSMRRVRLVRDNRTVSVFDLYDFIVRGDTSKDSRLLPGDVIVFPSAGPRVALLGAVNVPAIYELAGGDAPIGDVLALSGGLSVLTAPQRAQLERLDPNQPVARTVEVVSLGEQGLAQRLRDGDVLTLFPVGPQFADVVTLRGNVAAPLRYPFKPGMRIRDLIPEREALITADYYQRKNLMVQYDDEGQKVKVEQARRDVKNGLEEVNWDYAVIERLDLGEVKMTLIPFNLGRVVLQNDESANLELKAGDVVTVFSRRDLQVPQAKQTRMVRIEGEVAAPGIYTVAPGETLPQLLSRVGGLTPEAYVYGTALTRESVRKSQQANLETVVKRLEEQMTADIGARQASVTADGGAAAAQQARLANEERLARQRLQRLRSMQPSGRVSLELEPKAPALPAVPLEDGDRLMVPPRPSFVSVMGAVYNENVLLWKPKRTVGDYLKAAGPTETADLDALFVLRADGSIVSRFSRGWLRGGVDGLQLAPGDMVVIPEKVDRESTYSVFMRGLKDWTQVIYQLGLGAAAIKVLRD